MFFIIHSFVLCFMFSKRILTVIIGIKNLIASYLRSYLYIYMIYVYTKRDSYTSVIIWFAFFLSNYISSVWLLFTSSLVISSNTINLLYPYNEKQENVYYTCVIRVVRDSFLFIHFKWKENSWKLEFLRAKNYNNQLYANNYMKAFSEIGSLCIFAIHWWLFRVGSFHYIQ